MKFYLSLIFALFFLGCKQADKIDEPEKKIIYLNLYPDILPDTIGNPQLYVKHYVEYNPQNDSLLIAISTKEYQLNDIIQYKDIPHYGLDTHFIYKYTTTEKSQFDKLFSQKLENHYYRSLDKNTIDDRNPQILIIREGDNSQIIVFENSMLPQDLQEIIKKLDAIIESDKLISSSKNISENLIQMCQEELFSKNPPPPFKAVIKIVDIDNSGSFK